MMAKAAEQQKAALADAKEKTDEAVKAAKNDAPPPPKKGEPKAAEPKAADPEPVAVKDSPPPPKEPVAAPPSGSGSGGYATFARKRDAIEKLFETDPMVLQKSTELQTLYGDYLEDAYELDKKWGKETAKKPDHMRLNARLRDAELFVKSGKKIDSIAGKLGIR